MSHIINSELQLLEKYRNKNFKISLTIRWTREKPAP